VRALPLGKARTKTKLGELQEGLAQRAGQFAAKLTKRMEKYVRTFND